MPNKALKILFLYNGIFMLGGSLLGPLYAIYVEKLNTGIFPVSLSWAVFLISTTIFTYILSKNGDRFRHKRLLLAGGFLVRAMSWLSMAFITSIEQLIFVQFILGIGEALGSPAFDAIFAEHLDKNKHIMDYSDWKVISNGVLVLGTITGGYVVSIYGFTSLFVVMYILAMIAFIGVLINPSVDSKKAVK